MKHLQLFLVDHRKMTTLSLDLSEAIAESVALRKARIPIHWRRWLPLHNLGIEVALLMKEVEVGATVQGSSPAEMAECEGQLALDS